MKILITQSNYIPWKGYFDSINLADTVVLYDEMQYTKRDWRNRNKIITPQGPHWLTIPVDVKGKYNQKINETIVSDRGWAMKHWKTISFNYSKAKFFKTYEPLFKGLFEQAGELEYLSKINRLFISEICGILDINTELKWSKEFNLRGDKSEKLLNICKDLSGTTYLSGPAASGYLDCDLFTSYGVNIKWLDYEGYPDYEQLFGEFEHGVSILDLIFNKGHKAKNYMKSFICD